MSLGTHPTLPTGASPAPTSSTRDGFRESSVAGEGTPRSATPHLSLSPAVDVLYREIYASIICGARG